MKKKIRIAITGPESTAKSTLTKELAAHFKGAFYPEYAREYFENHSAHYTIRDIENITRKQVEQYRESGELPNKYIFFDTWLIISKVWFHWVYKTVPQWVENEMDSLPMDLYLLCLPDIPWVPDPLRENGGAHRHQLFEDYKKELITRNLNFVEIGGEGRVRVRNAIQAIEDFFRS